MSIWPENTRKKLRGLFTRNSAIFLVCVLIATVFWLLTKLSKDYTSDIRMPVVYSNLPEDKVLREKLPEQLTLYVNASGWDLLRHYLNLSSSAVIVDAKEFSENGRMVTNNYRNVFSQQLQDKFEVQRVVPSQISFDFFNKSSRTLPVKLVSDISIHPQYGLTDTVQLTPDSVTVTGPAPFVDSLEWIFTDTLVLHGLSQTTRGDIALHKPRNANVDFSIEQVEYKIPVAQYTETDINVPIKMVNAGQTAILLTKEAQVSFQVPVDQIREYEKEGLKRQFDVVADFKGVTPGDSLVPLRLVTFPESVRNVAVSPKAVSFLFLKQ